MAPSGAEHDRTGEQLRIAELERLVIDYALELVEAEFEARFQRGTSPSTGIPSVDTAFWGLLAATVNLRKELKLSPVTPNPGMAVEQGDSV